MSSTQLRDGLSTATTSLHGYHDTDVTCNVSRSCDGEYIIAFKVKHREVITVWLDDSQATTIAMALQSLLPRPASQDIPTEPFARASTIKQIEQDVCKRMIDKVRDILNETIKLE